MYIHVCIYMYIHVCMYVYSRAFIPPQSNYTLDYTQTDVGRMTFNLVFAVMFNGCSGIMGEKIYL